MAITIKEVAREAGVSVATVSRVINNSGPVGTETRERIEAAARALRYVPNGAARSLITSRTNTIGVLLPDIFGEFFSEVLRGMDRAVQGERHHLLVSSSHEDRGEIEAALRAMRGRVDGLVVMSPDLNADSLRDNLPAALPVVLLNCFVDDTPFDSINLANFEGAFEVTSHLIGLGHTRIALAGGPERNYDARERLRGYREALRAHGLPVEPALEFKGDFSDTSGHAVALEALRLDPRPTALICCNDSMAIGAVSALRDAGLRVPDDVAVTGFDDIPMARYFSPPLTTVHAPLQRLGARAVELLLNPRDAARRLPHHEVLPTSLVVRASSVPPL